MIGRARDASSRCATRATIGVPSISASNLFGPPIRRDWPAASSNAPIRGAWRRLRRLVRGWFCLGARQRPRRDLGQKAAAAHAHDLGRPDRQTGDQPLAGPNRSR